MRTHLRLLLAVGLALPACDDASGPQTGRLSVSTHTEGNDPDANGYVLTVGEADSLELDPTGTSELDLAPGQYTLRLLDVPGHCSVAPAATLQVEVPPAGTAQITFAITCARDQGTLVVSTETEGADPDPDGFQLVVDGIAPLAMNPNDTAEVDLAPGHYTLQLRGVADPCSVSPGMPLEVDITGGSTTTVAFEINCPLTGTLTGARITVRTTGPDPDWEYRVLVDAGGSRMVGIPSNGTTVIQLDPGLRTIGLTDVASNCEIDGPASHTLTIKAAEVVSVEFAVVCIARTTLGYITGNWQLGTRSTVPGMRPMTIAGSITQSGTAVSGSVHVAGSKCFDSLTTIGLTGTLAGYDISVTSTAAERQVITFTGSVTSDSLTGTYSINGGCANGDRGAVIGAKVRPINGTWRIIFNWNDQHVGVGLAGLTQATRSSEGSFAVAGTVTNSFDGSTCYQGTVTGGTFPSHSFMMGRSVTLEIETGCGTVVLRGTVNESGSGIVGHYRVLGGTDGGLFGSVCLGRNIYAGCSPPPF